MKPSEEITRDEATRQLLTQLPELQPSPDFTATVMQQVAAVPHKTFQPVTYLRSWWVLIIGVAILLATMLWFTDGAEAGMVWLPEVMTTFTDQLMVYLQWVLYAGIVMLCLPTLYLLDRSLSWRM
ncbi:MAG: hypothetical protein AAGB22_12025 [Bacteroidota bacterium]